MDTPLAVQLQQAWLHTHFNKYAPSQPPWTPYLPSSPAADSTSWRYSEPVAPSNDGAFPTTSSSSSSSSSSDTWGSSSSPYRGPSFASSDPWMPGNHDAHIIPAASVVAGEGMVASAVGASGRDMASHPDDVLMDPVLDFISDMLMDEQMEDRKCMRQECMAYQAIVQRALANDSSLSPSYGREQRGGHSYLLVDSREDCRPSFRRGEELGVEDYDWINGVLVADPLVEDGGLDQTWSLVNLDTPVSGWPEQGHKMWTWPSESSTSSSSSEQDVKVWSLDSSSSGSPYSQDSPTGLAEYGFSMPPRIATVPLPNLASMAPSFPSIPSLQDVPQKEKMPYEVTENGPVLENHIRALLTSKSSFSDVKGGYMGKLPKEAELLHNDTVGERKPCQLESVPTQEAELSFVKNEYLNAEKNAKIFRDWTPEQLAWAAKKKQARQTIVKKSKKLEPVDLRALLVDCAQAVGSNNLKKANEIVQELRQHTSPHGSATQRLAHYFTEALVARLSGTGASLYTAMSNNRPSAAVMLKAFRLIVEVCPYAKLAHYFANQNILKVAEGASRLHIVDYGILYGVQWPCLISALAERKGGPPFLRITGIEFPQPGANPAERIEQTGRRLAEYAKAYNVPFEYNAIASKWEDVEPSALNLREGEVLVVNCIQRLRHLMDETVTSPSPRRKVLSRMCSLNPDIVLIAILNAGYNAPFFVSRFREAQYHYSSKFDMIETTVADSENPLRLMMERECLGRDILNVVACEGPERVERPETYRQWQARFQRAGFELLKLDRTMLRKARDVVKAMYHKDFSVDDDTKWMLLGWKGRIVEGLSAWRPSASAVAM